MRSQHYTTDVGNSTTTQEDMPLYAGGRIGMLNKTTGRYSFELTDHLGNVRSVIAKNTSSNAVEVLSYSDYYPHGGVLPGRNYVSSPAYKLGYQGQEKDGETNFINFELRQFDPRLGRWFNPDPMGQYYSPYLGMGNNPVSVIDPTGGYSVGGGDFGFDDGAVEYAGYSYQDPFFARDFEKLNHMDPMMDAENRQRWNDNNEYYRAHTNSKGEWGNYEKQVTTTTHTPSIGDPTTTETTKTVFVANPAVAIEGLNAAYLNGNRPTNMQLSPKFQRKLERFKNNNPGAGVSDFIYFNANKRWFKNLEESLSSPGTGMDYSPERTTTTESPANVAFNSNNTSYTAPNGMLTYTYDLGINSGFFVFDFNAQDAPDYFEIIDPSSGKTIWQTGDLGVTPDFSREKWYEGTKPICSYR